MKPILFVVSAFLVFALIAVMARSCQEDLYIYDSEVELVSSDGMSSDVGKGDEYASEKISAGVSDWPDSIFYLLSDADYLSQIDKAVVCEINKCRTNPSRYADEVLRPFMKLISSEGTFIDSEGFGVLTKEGVSAVEEAINALEIQVPLPMLRPRRSLCFASADHCNDQGQKGLVGHNGSDGSTPLSRVLRYNRGCKGCGENIDYGFKTGVEIVRSLIIDDGVPSRGHRKNIFHDYHHLGTAFGPHAVFRYMCVIDFE